MDLLPESRAKGSTAALRTGRDSSARLDDIWCFAFQVRVFILIIFFLFVLLKIWAKLVQKKKVPKSKLILF